MWKFYVFEGKIFFYLNKLTVVSVILQVHDNHILTIIQMIFFLIVMSIYLIKSINSTNNPDKSIRNYFQKLQEKNNDDLITQIL